MMAVYADAIGLLSGVVELDEKYLGGKPRFQHGVKHPRGKGTKKTCVHVAVSRNGPVLEHFENLLQRAVGTQLRRTIWGGVTQPQPLFGG